VERDAMLPQLARPQIEALHLHVESKNIVAYAPYFSAFRNDEWSLISPLSGITGNMS